MKREMELWIKTRQATGLYDDMLKDVSKQFRLAIVEVEIISFLHFNPQRDTAADIVELRMLSKGCVSKAVEGLIQKSLLQRSQDSKDRRRIHLQLLPAASPIVQEIERVQEAFWEVIFNGFSEQELFLYSDFNNRILQNTHREVERRRQHEPR